MMAGVRGRWNMMREREGGEYDEREREGGQITRVRRALVAAAAAMQVT